NNTGRAGAHARPAYGRGSDNDPRTWRGGARDAAASRCSHMSSRGTASQIVAAFAASFDSSKLRKDHVAQVGRALVDTMAVPIAPQHEPAVRRAYDYVETLTPPLAEEQGTRPGRLASLWGRGQQSTVEGAALFNGIAAHALDFDDASSPMSGHPSIVLLPCLIALAEARHIEGMRVASAYVVGFEVCCKLGR